MMPCLFLERNFFQYFSEWVSSFCDLCSMKSFLLVMLLAVYLDCCLSPFYLVPVFEFLSQNVGVTQQDPVT